MKRNAMRVISLLLIGGFLFCSFASIVQANQDAETVGLTNGQIYYIICWYQKTNATTGEGETVYRAWDVSAGNTANGADVAHYTESVATLWQQWQLRYMGDGYYAFINMHSGKFLTYVCEETKAEIENHFLQTYGTTMSVSINSSIPHDLRMYEQMDLDCQKFKIQYTGHQYLISPKSNESKVVTAVDTEALMTLVLEDLIPNDSRQLFSFVTNRASGVVHGEAYNLINKNSDNALTVPGGGASNGMFVTDELYYSATPWQRWRILHEGAGVYVLEDANSGNLLSIGGSDPNAGGRVWTYSNDGTSGQRFQIVRNSDGTYSFLSKCSNYTMALTLQPSGKYVDGNFDQQPFVRSDNQKFYLALNGIYNIQNRLTGKSLDVSSGYTANGSDVSQYTPTFGTLWQQWYITYAGQGNYHVTDMNSGNLLSVSGSSSAERANVHIWVADGTTGQKLKIDCASVKENGYFNTYYTFYTQCSNYTKAVGVEGMNNGDTFLQLVADGGYNKQFSLTKLRTDPVPEGLYFFQCVATNRYMEKDGNDKFAEQRGYTGEDKQIWKITYESEEYYTICNYSSFDESGLDDFNCEYLTVQPSYDNKLKVQLSSRLFGSDRSRQKWKLHILPNGKWELQAQYHNGTALVLAVGDPFLNSSSFEDGVNVEQRNDDTDRDEWRLCRTMNTEWIGQGDTSWCWVTSAKMITESYGYKGSQYPSRDDAIINEFGSLMSEGGDAQDIAQACEFLTNGEMKFSYFMDNRIYSEEMMRLLLDDGNPIVLGYTDVNDENGHAIVVYGYYYDGNICRFLVQDPSVLNYKNASYSEILTLDNDGVITYWKQTAVKHTAYNHQTCSNLEC